MPSLYWAIHWPLNVYTLDDQTENAIRKTIQGKLLGQQLKTSDIGCKIEKLVIRMGSTEVTFSAELEKIDPPAPCTVSRFTEIYVRLAIENNPAYSLPGDTDSSSPIGSELDDFIMWQEVFDPLQTTSHYMQMYHSLVGIEKETILEEIAGLLAPVEAREQWSYRHYSKLVPLIRTSLNKAPVIVFGGDPGTGKTALATSIGAPLAVKLKKRVHFRHMSLLMRGMGYQGRAGAMIVKSFERIKEEYSKQQEPMLLFFDEAEAIVGSRKQADTSSGSQENIAIVDAIIVGVDSLRKGLQAQIVVLFATNLVDHIDAALLRRCYYHQFRRPDEQTRYMLLQSSLAEIGFSDHDLVRVTEATHPVIVDGVEVPFTYSDITELIIGRALNQAVQMNLPLTLDLLLDCCQKAHPTESLGKQRS